jgi:hypothetical protein
MAEARPPYLLMTSHQSVKLPAFPETHCAIDDKRVLYRQGLVLGCLLVDICNATKQIHVITCWRNNYAKCYTIFIDPSGSYNMDTA